MADIELLKYVHEQQKLGTHMNEILGALLAKGYTDDEIDDAFRIVGEAEITKAHLLHEKDELEVPASPPYHDEDEFGVHDWQEPKSTRTEPVKIKPEDDEGPVKVSPFTSTTDWTTDKKEDDPFSFVPQDEVEDKSPVAAHDDPDWPDVNTPGVAEDTQGAQTAPKPVFVSKSAETAERTFKFDEPSPIKPLEAPVDPNETHELPAFPKESAVPEPITKPTKGLSRKAKIFVMLSIAIIVIVAGAFIALKMIQ